MLMVMRCSYDLIVVAVFVNYDDYHPHHHVI